MFSNKDFLNNTLEAFYDFSKNKKVILFGAYTPAEKTIREILNVRGISPTYFIDNDFRKWYKQLYGFKIYEPRKVLQEDLKNIVVLITSTHPYQIMEQLEEMGISNYFASSLFIDTFINKEARLVNL